MGKTKQTGSGEDNVGAERLTAARKGHAKAEVEQAVPVDRRARSDRRALDRRKKDAPVACERRKVERRIKVSRRRQIDPTTCERDYSLEEVEFMHALDAYKHTSGRMFPTCSEILEVVRGLGYERRPTPAVMESANVAVAQQHAPATSAV